MIGENEPTYRQLLALLLKRGVRVVSTYEHNANTWSVEFAGEGRRNVQVMNELSPREYSKRQRESDARARAVRAKARELGLIPPHTGGTSGGAEW